MYFRVLVISCVAIMASACASYAPRAGNMDTCVTGLNCTIKGLLSLHAGQPPAWIAHVKAGDLCAKLALPNDFYDGDVTRKRWNGAYVVATGRAVLQPKFDESDGVATLWYEEGGRMVGMGMCDQGIVIYVESMRSESGMIWPVQ